MLVAILSACVSAAYAEPRTYTLQNAYNAALGSNEMIKIAEEGLVQANSRVDQAMTYLYPRLTGSAAYTRFNETIPPTGDFIVQPLNQLDAGLILTQPLYTGGRTMAGLRTAKTLREVSTRDLSTTRQDTLLNVAQAYYGVLKAQRLVDMSRDSLSRMERHQKITQREAQTRKTRTNTSNLLRARTLVSQSRIYLVRDEDGLRIARQQLHLVSNLPEDARVSEPAPQSAPAQDLQTLHATARSNRDDYAASKLNQRVAAENITIVKGAHYPQVYAEGGLRYKSTDPTTIDEGTVYYGGLRLSIPIFEGGLMKAEVSEAKSKLRQAELSTAFLERSIDTDVNESYVNLQTVSSVLDTVKLQYEDARENFNAVESLFSQGLAPSLSLIDAQQALFLAERELVNATYDQQIAILRLKKSIGVLGKE